MPAHSTAVAEAVGGYLDAWATRLATLIDEAKAAGELTTGSPSGDLAEFIVDAFEGGAVKAKATSSVGPMLVFRRTVDQLLR